MENNNYSERQLLRSKEPVYGIYQLKKDDDSLRDYHFTSFERLQKAGLKVERKNYDLIYIAPLSQYDTLDSIYEKFNLYHPADFAGHSLSMSDVIVLKDGRNITAHYVDTFGFEEIPDFIQSEMEM